MNNVHAPPRNPQEKIEILRFARRQIDQVLDLKPITCACCEKDHPILHVYRCYFCGLYFCRLCAKEHFGHHSGEVRG